MKMILQLVLLLVPGLSFGGEFFRATGVRVVDGDTLAIESLSIGFGVSLPEVKVRALGVNTPERGEKDWGRATQAMRDFVAEGDLYVVPNRNERDRDNFGRLLGELYIKTQKGKVLHFRKVSKWKISER